MHGNKLISEYWPFARKKNRFRKWIRHNLCTDTIRTATKLHMHTLKIHSMIYQNAVKIMGPSSSGSICTMCDRKPFTFSSSTPETKNRLRENCNQWSLCPWLQRGDTNTLDSAHFAFYRETSETKTMNIMHTWCQFYRRLDSLWKHACRRHWRNIRGGKWTKQ